MNNLPDRLRKLITYDKTTGKLFNLGGKEVFCQNHQGYKRGQFQYKNLYAHRVVWLLHYGEWPKNTVDHINGDKTDNRIENLRDVTLKENAKNKPIRKDSRTGVCGVSIRYGKYYSTIKVGDKTVWLGYFDSLHDATIARKEAEVKFNYHPNHGR